jgi:hypothetical protein
VVDGVHRLRCGRACRPARSRRGGDLLTAGGGTIGEPVTVDVGITELIAFPIGDARPADGHTDHGPTKCDTRTHDDAAAGHAGADDRPFGAGELPAVADEDALSTLAMSISGGS